jgi:hypothetical protein
MASRYYLDEQLFDPRARAEAYDHLQGLKEGHLVELVAALKREAEEDTKDWRRRSKEWWDLWDNDIVFNGKEDWQSQVWVGQPFATAEQATALIQRALVDNPEFWGIQGKDDRDRLLVENLWKPLLETIIAESHFAEKYVDLTRSGFVTGCAGYLKPRLQVSMVPVLAGVSTNPTGAMVPQFQHTQRTFIALDWVDPRSVYRDPESRPRENYSGSYLFHTEWKPGTFLQVMRNAGWNPEAVSAVLARAGRGGGLAARTATTATDSDRQRQEQKANYAHRFRTSFLVNEGWLDILDENGELVFPDALMIECAGKIVYLNENPLWATDLGTGRRKWPLLATAPIPHPTKFIGRGVLEQDAGLSWLFSNAFNLMTDGMNWMVNPEAEVFKDALDDPDDLVRYPGKLWVKRKPERAFIPSENGRIDLQAMLGFLNFLNQTKQNTNFVTDFAVGLPGTRSNVTKGEVEIKTAQSLAVFQGIGFNLELVGREVIELIQQMATQFLMTDTANPTIARILGTRNAYLLAQAPIEQRVQMVQGNFDYTFTGVSQALQKTDLMQRLQQFAQLIGAQPYMSLLLQQPQVFMDVIAASKDLLGLGDRIEVQTELAPMAGPLAAINPAVLSLLMEGGTGAASEAAPPMPGMNQGPPTGFADPAAMAGL